VVQIVPRHLTAVGSHFSLDCFDTRLTMLPPNDFKSVTTAERFHSQLLICDSEVVDNGSSKDSTNDFADKLAVI
jgi:hypothetical protein